tara:strand:+ start:210 stop:446 length:237 start_codon:yes stop_codon:yes gene_type:complete
MYPDTIDQNKIVLSDSNKLSFHVATAEYRGKIVCSAPNRAGELYSMRHIPFILSYIYSFLVRPACGSKFVAQAHDADV